MKSSAFLLATALVFSASAAFAQTSPTGTVGTGASQSGTINTSTKAGTYDSKDLDPNTNKDRRKTMKSKDKSMKMKTKTPVEGKMNSQM